MHLHTHRITIAEQCPLLNERNDTSHRPQHRREAGESRGREGVHWDAVPAHDCCRTAADGVVGKGSEAGAPQLDLLQHVCINVSQARPSATTEARVTGHRRFRLTSSGHFLLCIPAEQ